MRVFALKVSHHFVFLNFSGRDFDSILARLGEAFYLYFPFCMFLVFGLRRQCVVWYRCWNYVPEFVSVYECVVTEVGKLGFVHRASEATSVTYSTSHCDRKFWVFSFNVLMFTGPIVIDYGSIADLEVLWVSFWLFVSACELALHLCLDPSSILRYCEARVVPARIGKVEKFAVYN